MTETETETETETKVNAREHGWTIRGYKAGDYYADIFCPHGRPVEAINTEGKQIYPRQALRDWYQESKGWTRNYCDGHRSSPN